MYTLTITCSTADELQGVVNKLNDVDAAPAPKKATNATKGAAATKEAFAEKPAAAPKAAAAKGKKAAPTVDQLREHILNQAGDDASASDNVKAFVKTFGVGKIGDMTEAQRQKAHDTAEEYFANLGGEAEEEAEEDPMA